VADNLSPDQRSFAMSRVKGRDTSIERMLRSRLHEQGYRFRKHVKELPGKPDIVFSKKKVAVFVDGDFWHGYRFPTWEHKLTSFWQNKIRKTRCRDTRNFRNLRRRGWIVIRIWGHDIKNNLDECIRRICSVLDKG